MRRVFTLLMAAVVGGGVVYTAFQYHVVRAEKRVLLVPKQRADWHDAYVDVRGWTHREWGEHADLSRNLVTSGHGDIVSRSVTDELFRGLFDKP
ncbi:MAG TPA: hypothetical protein VL475_08365 [Planctomycetaceae bacterium]|jgi:hypothetical protein|nr:hypothetical protein [Planctomycetaceae bacterium]